MIALEKEISAAKRGSLVIVDSDNISSTDTRRFMEASSDLFSGAALNNHLWKVSALRFFLLADVMASHHLKEVLHVEADNMLYLPLSDSILSALRRDFPLAATPLIAGAFTTASVFWVSDASRLLAFTSFLLDLALKRGRHWANFEEFMWQQFCCKVGGLFARNASSEGVKPYALNEMAMLTHFHSLYPATLRHLPIIPLPLESLEMQRDEFSLSSVGLRATRRNASANSANSVTSEEVSEEVLNVLWDSGSYGQYLGGTWKKRGKDVGFVDPSHIIGRSIEERECRPKIVCTDGRRVFLPATPTLDLSTSASEVLRAGERGGGGRCFTAPAVRCAAVKERGGGGWSLLWNLHIHSKQTEKFVSRGCECKTSSASEGESPETVTISLVPRTPPPSAPPLPPLSSLGSAASLRAERGEGMVTSQLLLRLLLMAVAVATLCRLCCSSSSPKGR